MGKRSQQHRADEVARCVKFALGHDEHAAVPICDCCVRFGRDLTDGYCHLAAHGYVPKSGYCSGFVPVRGITVEEVDGNVSVTFSGEFLKAVHRASSRGGT